MSHYVTLTCLTLKIHYVQHVPNYIFAAILLSNNEQWVLCGGDCIMTSPPIATAKLTIGYLRKIPPCVVGSIYLSAGPLVEAHRQHRSQQ